MVTLLIPLIHTLNSGFRTRAVLLAEILALRHQLAVLKQSTKNALAWENLTGSSGWGCAVGGQTGGILS